MSWHHDKWVYRHLLVQFHLHDIWVGLDLLHFLALAALLPLPPLLVLGGWVWSSHGHLHLGILKKERWKQWQSWPKEYSSLDKDLKTNLAWVDFLLWPNQLGQINFLRFCHPLLLLSEIINVGNPIKHGYMDTFKTLTLTLMVSRSAVQTHKLVVFHFRFTRNFNLVVYTSLRPIGWFLSVPSATLFEPRAFNSLHTPHQGLWVDVWAPYTRYLNPMDPLKGPKGIFAGTAKSIAGQQLLWTLLFGIWIKWWYFTDWNYLN